MQCISSPCTDMHRPELNCTCQASWRCCRALIAERPACAPLLQVDACPRLAAERGGAGGAFCCTEEQIDTLAQQARLVHSRISVSARFF